MIGFLTFRIRKPQTSHTFFIQKKRHHFECFGQVGLSVGQVKLLILMADNMSITSSNTNRNCEKIRIVLLGDQSVGKSSIIDRYTTNRYEQNHNATVGIDFNVRDVTKYGKVYRLQMWDTAGQERYRSLIPTYLKNAQCVIFVYDVTKQNSLQNIRMWQKLFKQHQEAPGILVGNKIDLTTARKVRRQEGQQLAQQLKLKYYEVSAKTGKKVSDLFDEVLETIITQIKKEEEFVQSSRQKIKDFKTVESQGIEETKEDNSKRNITLKGKMEEYAKNLPCC